MLPALLPSKMDDVKFTLKSLHKLYNEGDGKEVLRGFFELIKVIEPEEAKKRKAAIAKTVASDEPSDDYPMYLADIGRFLDRVFGGFNVPEYDQDTPVSSFLQHIDILIF